MAAAGCSPSVFPMLSEQVPSEFTGQVGAQLQLDNAVVKDNAVSDEAVQTPNNVLMKSDFKVYYDNTMTCFMEYAKLFSEAPNDRACLVFTQSMKSYKAAFDSSKSYKTYTLQSGGDGVLGWKEYGDNIMMDFANLDAYTNHAGQHFTTNTAPVNLWVDVVANELSSGSKSTYVYLSDLNEQNGLLTECGKSIKTIMDKYPDKDFIIMPYELDYKGGIALPTDDTFGLASDQTGGKTFKDYVKRMYYAVAIGDRNTLTALYNTVSQNFSDVDLSVDKFMYRDAYYKSEERAATDKSGNQLTAEIVEQTPAVFKALVDGKEPAAPAPDADAKADPFGGSPNGGEPASAIQPCSDVAPYFRDTTFTGNTYQYVCAAGAMDQGSGEITVTLENAALYSLDTQNAVFYTFNNAMLDNSGMVDPNGNNSDYWIKADDFSKPMSSASASISDSSVTIKLNHALNRDADSACAVLVSIPVNVPYTQKTSHLQVMDITGIEDFVGKCNVPAIREKGQEELEYTRTYGFDTFMDILTGYKAIAAGGSTRNTVDLDNGASEPTAITETVDRLNIVILCDQRYIKK